MGARLRVGITTGRWHHRHALDTGRLRLGWTDEDAEYHQHQQHCRRLVHLLHSTAKQDRLDSIVNMREDCPRDFSPKDHKPGESLFYDCCVAGPSTLVYMRGTTLHVSQKKLWSRTLAITLSNLNRFQKFLHCCKEKEISNKPCAIIPTTP